jgi:hypothetical protein
VVVGSILSCSEGTWSTHDAGTHEVGFAIAGPLPPAASPAPGETGSFGGALARPYLEVVLRGVLAADSPAPRAPPWVELSLCYNNNHKYGREV